MEKVVRFNLSMEIIKSKKRSAKKNVDKDGPAIPKKKKKLENGAKATKVVKNKEKIKNKKQKINIDGTPKFPNRKQKGKTEQVKPSKLKGTPTSKKNTVAPSKEKMIDYKQFRLKKMKEKWKDGNAKRNRSKNDGEMETPANRKERPHGVKPEKKPIACETFGPCNIAELIYHWNEYATNNLTAVEREELSFEPSNVAANAKGKDPSRFFAKHVPDWKKWLKREIPNGCPQIIVVCSSAIRAVELNRALNRFKGSKCVTTKLIRKEKAKDQAKFLSDKRVRLAIGTPHRIELLLSQQCLRLDECRVIALDWSYEDQKKCRLISIPEVRKDVLELFHKYFIPVLKTQEDVSLFLL